MSAGQPDACVLRVTDVRGQTVGTGFLVSADGLVATCAHVVAAAQPHIAFPNSDPQPAELVTFSLSHDVAFLRLLAPLPAGAKVASLAPSSDREGVAIRSFGYPRIGNVEGLWGVGHLLGYVWEDRKTLLQLSSTQITRGFSGGPVWEAASGRVIGMVVQLAPADQYGRLDDVAFAVSAETLQNLCPAKLILHRDLTPGAPFQAPAVPRYFIPRPEASDSLRVHLLAEGTGAAGALIVSAVHGLGGIGKTTLVAALAHEPDVMALFPDGILWATLGTRPDELSLLAGWIQALGDYSFRPTVTESASAHLRTLLHAKSCLLVLDDAWQAESVRAFLVGGERCRVLVTTRDATLARKVGALLYDLDVMTASQALALFEARLGSLVGHRKQAEALARALGFLPLALELAAVQIEAGLSWAELLGVFHEKLADLRALDLDEAIYRNESLRLSFRLSLERLLVEDQSAFPWLGVLAEDARLTPAMAATLWGQPEIESRKRLRRLRDKALLQTPGGDQYSVHDLLRDEAALHLSQQMPLHAAHELLLQRYRAFTQDGLWHTLPDDGYIHTNLIWHLERAGREADVHALLREETPTGQNGWFQARERLGQTAGYLKDVARAGQLAETGFQARDRAKALGLQCRYALVSSSFTSLASNIPPSLLTALVEHAVLAPLQGLAYARQVPDPVQRTNALIGLAPALQEPLKGEARHDALQAVRAIRDEATRSHALAQLSPHLEGPLLIDAIAMATEFQDPRHHACSP